MSPPLWFGCDAITWARLLAHHHFAVHRSRWPVAALISAASVGQSALGLIQKLIYGRRVARMPILNAPVFILGHWRSGTTLLHELLSRDPRHTFPTTYECLAPHHFLLTRSWLPRLLRGLIPKRRPMDNMALGWDRPQEDEFALCLLGQPSPYERIAFPNRPAADTRALALQDLSPRAQRRWQNAFFRLAQALTLGKGDRRLILKSPPHTCRIPTLLELFPDARFVHIIRDPYVVYPSTLHLWRLSYGLHGLQRPTWKDLPEYILETFVRMYDRLEEGKGSIPPGRLHELRYEDLVRDPLGQLRALYLALELGDFEPARPQVEAYLAEVKNYQTNRYVLTSAERHAITCRWGAVIQRYGYQLQPD